LKPARLFYKGAANSVLQHHFLVPLVVIHFIRNVLHIGSKNKIEIDSKKQKQEIEHDKKKY